MSEEAAVKLGQEVLDKTYEPSSMAQCEPSLTLDRNPHAVQFTQFILFAKPRQSIRSPEPPEYLILQQAKPRGSNGRHPMIEALIKPLSRRLSGEVLKSDDRSQPAPETERLPDPDNPRTDVGRLRAFAAEHRIPGYAAGWTEGELRQGVSRWIDTTVPVSGSASYSVNSRVNQTHEQVRERTVQASNTLKTTRKVRIEVSREVGRERKQTHVISNTNRCHTLNCHYFEVMANYLVTMKLVKLSPCVLVPAVPGEVTPEWVLCHEALLKEALLSETFLPGFNGARVLATHETFKEVKQDFTDGQLEIYVSTIVTIFKDLLAVVEAVKDLSADQLVAAARAGCASTGCCARSQAFPKSLPTRRSNPSCGGTRATTGTR